MKSLKSIDKIPEHLYPSAFIYVAPYIVDPRNKTLNKVHKYSVVFRADKSKFFVRKSKPFNKRFAFINQFGHRGIIIGYHFGDKAIILNDNWMMHIDK